MKTELANKFTRSLHNVGLQLKKHAPELLVVAGVVGVVASAVMACKATTKLDEVLEPAKEDIDTIHTLAENNPEYTDSKKHLTAVYAKTGLELAKLYGPSVLLGAASLTAIIYSHGMLRQRNVALAAAYATVDKGFKEYRSRVVERFGADLDRELRYNLRAREIEVVETDEDGNEKTVKKTVSVTDDIPSVYARYFNESCFAWTKDIGANRVFVSMQQDAANRRLQEKGYLFLNEVYEMLGIDRVPEGQYIGWVYNPSDPDLNNYVDFGIYDYHTSGTEMAEQRNKAKQAFINCYERTILLDFNVDGVVYDLMK